MQERVLQKLELDKVIGQLLECCTCSLSQEKAQDLTPSTNITEIEGWQQDTSEAKELLRKEPLVPLGGIWDIRPALWKAERQGILEPHELLEVGSTLAASRRLKQFLASRVAEDSRLGQIAAALGTFPALERRIEECISEQGEVKDTASPALLRIRRQLITRQVQVRDKLDRILRQTELQKYLQEAIITIRGDRYVVPVKQEYRHQFPGLVHDQSASGATVYIEPLAVVQMSNEIRRYQAEEGEEINRILKELTAAAGAQAPEIHPALEGLAQLDFVLAKGKLSHQQDGIEPQLNGQGQLKINLGRHPLLPPDKVVPLTVGLGQDYDILVVTGPNTGGKTVALKTIGLLTLMAQAGLHVPADVGTRLGVFEQVFVDIGDEQSIEQSLSTFSSHMTNIVDILNQVNDRSLVLLDELGAGTDPSEGAALAISILEYLLERQVRTIATTHYSELKAFAYQWERVENASVEFNPETLQPTYRLLTGLPGRSNAFEIAARIGLKPGIVERARSHISAEELEVGDLIQDLKESQIKSEVERKEAEKLRIMQEHQGRELHQRQEAWREKETRLLQRAQAEAMEIVHQAKTEAEQMVRKLRQLQKETANRETLRAAQEARDALSSRYSKHYDAWTKVMDQVEDRQQPAEPAGEPASLGIETGSKVDRKTETPPRIWRKAPPQFKPGDSVFIPRLNQPGYVLTAPSADGEVQVQAGIMKIKVQVGDLRLVEEKREPAYYPDYFGSDNAQRPGQLMFSKSREVAAEVHLRGMLVDEALIELEKYLDDACLAGIPEVRVIHGKGTGTLRLAVQQYLSGHPQVKSYRIGGYREGGIGVTVAQLKD